jgi:hypothetical protein
MGCDFHVGSLLQHVRGVSLLGGSQHENFQGLVTKELREGCNRIQLFLFLLVSFGSRDATVCSSEETCLCNSLNPRLHEL